VLLLICVPVHYTTVPDTGVKGGGEMTGQMSANSMSGNVIIYTTLNEVGLIAHTSALLK